MKFPELFFAHQSAFFGTFRSLLIGFHFVGNFEDFKALGALLELNIYFCKKIDCKNALEALPTMPWAGQIQKLDLSDTNAEGMQNFLKFAHQSAFFGMFLTIHLCAMLHVCAVELPATRTHHVRTGNIQVLGNRPNLTSVNFNGCNGVDVYGNKVGKGICGEHALNELSWCFLWCTSPHFSECP